MSNTNTNKPSTLLPDVTLILINETPLPNSNMNSQNIELSTEIPLPERTSRYRPPIRFDKYFLYQKENQLKVTQLVIFSTE